MGRVKEMLLPEMGNLNSTFQNIFSDVMRTQAVARQINEDAEIEMNERRTGYKSGLKGANNE